MAAKQECRWYREESERIIRDKREDELAEILKVRDAACALYVTATKQLPDLFPDSDVVDWLDREARSHHR